MNIIQKITAKIKERREYEQLSLLNILEIITLADCKEDEEGIVIIKDRIALIHKLLRNTQFTLIRSGKHSLIYSNRKHIDHRDNVSFISCHIDMVPEPFFTTEDDGSFRGTFDNSATAAVLLYSMRENLLPRNTVVAFTCGEEQPGLMMYGANEVCRQFINKSSYRIPCVVVTDVTGNSWFDQGYDISIENAFHVDMFLGHQVLNCLDQAMGVGKYGYQHFTPDGPLDETIVYAGSTPTLAVCLPVGNPDNMHSSDGVLIRSDEMYNYLRGLLAILHTISSEGIDYRWT